MKKEEYYAILREAETYSDIIIYGAHLIAEELLRLLQDGPLSASFRGFAVTSPENNRDSLAGWPVRPIQDYLSLRETAYCLIAAPEKFAGEIAVLLRELGFLHYGVIGLNGITCLLGDALAATNGKRADSYRLSFCADDFAWLDMEKPGEGVRVKYPVMTHVERKRCFERLARLDLPFEYFRAFGLKPVPPQRVQSVAGLPESSLPEGTLDVYVVTSHRDAAAGTLSLLPWEHALQAGAALTELRKCALLDCDGDSISERNPLFAEMTAMYWIWKNSGPAKYKGLCHYRRHFRLDGNTFRHMMAGTADAFLTTPRLAPCGVREMFVRDTPVNETVFSSMLRAIGTVHGRETLCLAEEYFDSPLYVPNNMLIARSPVFDAYCAWVFPVLFRMEAEDRETGYNQPDRHIAYAAELLTSLYFHLQREKLALQTIDYVFSEVCV